MRRPGHEQLVAVVELSVEPEEASHLDVGGLLEQGARRAGRDQPAVHQDQQPVGQRPRLGSVMDHHERGPGLRPQRRQRVLEQAGPHLRVQPGEGLIE